MVGLDSPSQSNGLTSRTPQNAPLENTPSNLGMSNPGNDLSAQVNFVLRCIAALDEYDLNALAAELWPNNDVFPNEVADSADIVREIHGISTIFSEVAREYCRTHPPLLKCVSANVIPDFDDPDFEAKLHADSAPLTDRKRLFIRLWETFELVDRSAFLKRVDPNGAFHGISA